MANSYFFNPMQYALKPLFEQALKEDAEFAEEVYEKEHREEKPKSFGECCEYILGEAYEWASNHREGNFGLAGMPDSEMVSLMKHYYDEDDIEIKKMGAGVKASVAKAKDKKEGEEDGEGEDGEDTPKKTAAKSRKKTAPTEEATGDIFSDFFNA